MYNVHLCLAFLDLMSVERHFSSICCWLLGYHFFYCKLVVVVLSSRTTTGAVCWMKHTLTLVLAFVLTFAILVLGNPLKNEAAQIAAQNHWANLKTLHSSAGVKVSDKITLSELPNMGRGVIIKEELKRLFKLECEVSHILSAAPIWSPSRRTGWLPQIASCSFTQTGQSTSKLVILVQITSWHYLLLVSERIWTNTQLIRRCGETQYSICSFRVIILLDLR